MDDLTAFISARLDEDEHIARMAAEDASAGANWHVDATYRLSGHAGVCGENGEVIVYDEGSPTQMEAEHIARHDPARTLREVAARRRTLERHEECGTGVGYCDDGGKGWEKAGFFLCNDKMDLASIWSDHPDYRDEWRVSAAD